MYGNFLMINICTFFSYKAYTLPFFIKNTPTTSTSSHKHISLVYYVFIFFEFNFISGRNIAFLYYKWRIIDFLP